MACFIVTTCSILIFSHNQDHAKFRNAQKIIRNFVVMVSRVRIVPTNPLSHKEVLHKYCRTPQFILWFLTNFLETTDRRAFSCCLSNTAESTKSIWPVTYQPHNIHNKVTHLMYLGIFCSELIIPVLWFIDK